MTLIVAIKHTGGTVLATDSRVMMGELKRDRAIKLEPLRGDIGIGRAGLIGVTDDILKEVKAFCNSSSLVTFDSVVSCLSDTALEWHKKNSEKLAEEDEEGYLAFIAVSPERIRKVLPKGYSEETYDYDCDGVGKPYAEYILGNFYRENLNEQEAKELAVYTILETSKMDPNVGEDIELLSFPKDENCKTISKEEIEDIKLRVVPFSKTVAETQIGLIQNIVSLREAVDCLWEKKFNYKLFQPNERAIFQVMKPCRSEEEFTSSIAALALLIEQLNVKKMKEAVGEREGSINILEEFARQHIDDFPSEIIQTFRDIMTLRSKKFPIHTTAPKFLEVVLKVAGTYPPKWPDVYLKALNLYKESLDRLMECLSKHNKTRD